MIGWKGRTRLPSPVVSRQSSVVSPLSLELPRITSTHRHGLSQSPEIQSIAEVRPFFDSLDELEIHDRRAMHAGECIFRQPRGPIPKRFASAMRAPTRDADDGIVAI